MGGFASKDAVTLTSEQLAAIAAQIIIPAGITLSTVKSDTDIADAISKKHSIQDLSGLQSKETGKGLSTNDYTTAEQTKLSGIAINANNYTHPSNHSPSVITQDASNRFVTDTEKSTWNRKGEKDTTAQTGMLKGNGSVIGVGADGTDYYSSARAIPSANIPNGISTLDSTLFTQSMGAGTYYYVPNSVLTMPAASKAGGGMSTSTTMYWDFMMRKTAAGTAAFNVCIYRGVNGTTGDTRDVTQSIGTATAVVDIAHVLVNLKVTATGATGSYTWSISVFHKAATAAGFGTTDATPFFSGTVSGVAMNTASLKFGIGLMGTTGTTALVLSGMTGQADNMN